MSDYSRVDVLRMLQEELPDEVAECEKSVREDNPDLSKSEAIAICRDQLDMEGECPDGQVMIGDQCVPVQQVDDVPPSMLSTPTPYHLQEFDPDVIERREEGDEVVYTNVKLLGPGIWTDSNSQRPVRYTPELMNNLSVEPDNSVHIFHDSGNEVSEVGHIDAESVTNADNGVFGDLVIDTSTAAGEFADENMQQTLETDGAEGFGGPSVEIPPEGQQVEIDQERGVEELVDGTISDVGLVKRPASKDVHFARQTANAAVALGDGGATVMLPKREMGDMQDATLDGAQVIETFGLSADDLDLEDGQELQDVAVQDIMGLVADALGVPAGDVMDALGPMMDGEEDDENGEERENEDGDDDDEEPEDDDENEGDGMDMEEIAQSVESLEERMSNVEDMVESAMAQEDLEDAISGELEDAREELADAETVAELREANEELERRLSELEDEPEEPRTLAEDGVEGDGDTPTPDNVTFVDDGARY